MGLLIYLALNSWVPAFAADTPEILGLIQPRYSYSIPTFQAFVPARVEDLEIGELIPGSSGGSGLPEVIVGSERFWIYTAKKGKLKFGASTWPITCVRIHKMRQANPQQPYVYDVSFSALEGACALNERDVKIRLKLRITDFVLGTIEKAWAKLYDLETEIQLYDDSNG